MVNHFPIYEKDSLTYWPYYHVARCGIVLLMVISGICVGGSAAIGLQNGKWEYIVTLLLFGVIAILPISYLRKLKCTIIHINREYLCNVSPIKKMNRRIYWNNVVKIQFLRDYRYGVDSYVVIENHPETKQESRLVILVGDIKIDRIKALFPENIVIEERQGRLA